MNFTEYIFIYFPLSVFFLQIVLMWILTYTHLPLSVFSILCVIIWLHSFKGRMFFTSSWACRVNSWTCFDELAIKQFIFASQVFCLCIPEFLYLGYFRICHKYFFLQNVLMWILYLHIPLSVFSILCVIWLHSSGNRDTTKLWNFNIIRTVNLE